MKTMNHSLSKRAKSAFSGFLAFVLIFGIVAVIAPTEAKALAIDATDSGYYNVSYGEEGATTFDDGTQIRVINNSRAGQMMSDAVYKYNGTSWSAADPNNYVILDDSDTGDTIYGVYPYTAEYTSFTIPTDQAGGVQDADWMTASSTAGTDNSVALNFQHLLAKVTVNITGYNTGLTEETAIISNLAIISRRKEINITYGDTGNTYSYTDGSLVRISPKVEVENKTYTAIIAPATYAATEPFVKFTIQGENERQVLATADVLQSGLEPGKHYTFNLTIGDDAAVSLVEVKVTDWISETIAHNSAAEQQEVKVDNYDIPTSLIMTTGGTISTVTDGTVLTAADNDVNAVVMAQFAEAAVNVSSFEISATVTAGTGRRGIGFKTPDGYLFFNVYPEETSNQVGYAYLNVNTGAQDSFGYATLDAASKAAIESGEYNLKLVATGINGAATGTIEFYVNNILVYTFENVSTNTNGTAVNLFTKILPAIGVRGASATATFSDYTFRAKTN